MGLTQASAEAGCVQAAAAPVVCERFDDLGADGRPVRLGIMGGTFDPIHIGHLACAEQAREAFGLDAVVFIPAGKPAFKLKRDVTPAEQRFEMCRLAVQGDPRFFVCDLELRRQGNSYTADTLRELEEIYPNTRFFLLMGTDMFLTVQNWYHAQEIFRRAILVAGARKKGEEELLKEQLSLLEALGAQGRIVPCQVVKLSSTQVRAARKRGENLSGMVPPAVEAYMNENKLYLPKEEKADGNG